MQARFLAEDKEFARACPERIKHRTLGKWYRTEGICVLSSGFCHIAEVEEECVGAPAETCFDKRGVFAGQVEMHCGPNTRGV